MYPKSSAVLLLGSLCLLGYAQGGRLYDYCIVGAGPAGLMLARLLHQADRSYIVFERAAAAGSFFARYPRHRVLDSVNMPSRGRDDHSLPGKPRLHSTLTQHTALAGSPLRFSQFSNRTNPAADELVAYLEAYAAGLNVLYNAEARLGAAEAGGDAKYVVWTKGGQHLCRAAIVATGLSRPRHVSAQMIGAELIDSYDTMEMDPSLYLNRTVIVLGDCTGHGFGR